MTNMQMTIDYPQLDNTYRGVWQEWICDEFVDEDQNLQPILPFSISSSFPSPTSTLDHLHTSFSESWQPVPVESASRALDSCSTYVR